ncbi:MAG: tRNA lysidine(34) synthetase TilS [Pseudomonadales bacterium]
MDTVSDAVDAALAAAPGRVFVAFSGGLDSTVLLHAAVRSRRDDLAAVHVNHGLHADAGSWQARCGAVCDRWGVPLVTRAVAVSRRGNLEAQARSARYGAFSALLERAGDRLLLAHHRDDQAETALLRLLQGRGLYGMPAERALGCGRLLRPLLALPRGDLEAYAAAWGLDWIEDPANADLRFDRNFVRHRLLPALRGRWPDADRAIVAALPPPPSPGGPVPVAELLALSSEEAVSELRGWLSAHGARSPRAAALAEFLRQLRAGADRQPVLDVGDNQVRRYAGSLHLVRPAPALATRYPLSGPGVCRLPHGELILVPDPGGFRPQGAMEVRFRCGGERLLTGGGHRSLKQLLQAARVPPWQRHGFPLIFDAAGLLAVPGIAHRPDGAGAGLRALWRPD